MPCEEPATWTPTIGGLLAVYVKQKEEEEGEGEGEGEGENNIVNKKKGNKKIKMEKQGKFK